MGKRFLVLSLATLTGVGATTGCFSTVTETERVTPAPRSTVVVAPPTQRVYTYPQGQYLLRGEGTPASPYYWVWVPSGTQVTALPPLPPIPQ